MKRGSIATSLLLSAASLAFLGASTGTELRPNRRGERLTNVAPPQGDDTTPRWLRLRHRGLTEADRDMIAAAEQKRLRRQARNLSLAAWGAFGKGSRP